MFDTQKHYWIPKVKGRTVLTKNVRFSIKNVLATPERFREKLTILNHSSNTCNDVRSWPTFVGEPVASGHGEGVVSGRTQVQPEEESWTGRMIHVHLIKRANISRKASQTNLTENVTSLS